MHTIDLAVVPLFRTAVDSAAIDASECRPTTSSSRMGLATLSLTAIGSILPLSLIRLIERHRRDL